MRLRWLLLALLLLPAWALDDQQKALLAGARSCLGDVYDSGYYTGGPPPKGRGACPEVVYYAYLKIGVDLQAEVDRDLRANPSLYPSRRDRNIDYRWCPNLIVWFSRHTKTLPRDSDWRAGDVVFFNLLGDGVADHIGIVSDKPGHVIHNLGPRCVEDRALERLRIVGHFRMPR
ncbi:MAG: DUF1287 domain-containing protein [Vulcanimicrobiota bacterium]